MPRVSVLYLILLAFVTSLAADTIVLKNGKRYDGDVIAERADSLVIAVERATTRQKLGVEWITIARADVASIRYEDLSNVEADLTIPRDPDYNSIMFCPTPATMPKGDFYFRDFELYILNFGWGVTESTSLSFMTHFPIVSFMDFGSIGFKQGILDRTQRPLGLAIAGSYTFATEDISEDSFLTGSLITGIGDRERSLNLAVNQSYKKGEDPFTTFVLGGDMRVSRRTKFFVEYMNATDFIDDDDLNGGFLNFGIRFFGNDWSFSLSGFRPMADTGRFMAWPMFMFSYHAE